MKPLLITLFIYFNLQGILFADITVEYMEGDAYILNEKSQRKLISLGDTFGRGSILYTEEFSLIELNCNGNMVTVDEQGYYPAVLFLSDQSFQEKKKVLADISTRITKIFNSDTDLSYRYDSVGGLRDAESESESLTWENEEELLQYAEKAIKEEDWNRALFCLEEYKKSAAEIQSQYHILLAYIYIQKNIFQYAVNILESADINEGDEYFGVYQELKSVLTE